MVAKLWFNKIIAGDKCFKDVPAKLKDAVKKLLIEAGREDLIEE